MKSMLHGTAMVLSSAVAFAAQAQAPTPFGHPNIPDLIADPSIVEFDGVFNWYATTDGSGAGLATSGVPVVWKSKDFLNWSFKGPIFPPDFEARFWAPSMGGQDELQWRRDDSAR